MAPSVTLLVPVLNEIDGMRTIMPRVRPDWCEQILVVDGRSTDGTADYARAQGYDVLVQSRPGIRHAYIEAWPHIRGRAVVTFSPDGNSIPELIPTLASKVLDDGYDMVIASRYAPGARSTDDDAVTAFGNWAFTRLINLLHGARYTDAMVIFRAYRTSLFTELELDRPNAYAPERLFGTVIGCEPLLSVRAAKRRLRLLDIPGDEPPRVGGQRKLQVFGWGASYLVQVIRERFWWP
jgi:glycosyltransferase involved in cell wall biosynthesis